MEIALDPLECAYVGGLFAACVGLWRNKRVHHRRATGEDPEVLSQATRPTQRYFAQMVRVLAAGLALLLLGHAAGVVWPGLLRLPALDVRWVDHAGFALGVLGLGLCALAQRTMGSAWRVGIDEVRRTPLVEFGIFAHIRNPTYTGLFALIVGVWLIWPSASLATFALLFFFMMEMQVRCEEEHLEGLHGDAFRRYRDRTRRYVPFVY